jgi:hypothetical protein
VKCAKSFFFVTNIAAQLAEARDILDKMIELDSKVKQQDPTLFALVKQSEKKINSLGHTNYYQFFSEEDRYPHEELRKYNNCIFVLKKYFLYIFLAGMLQILLQLQKC